MQETYQILSITLGLNLTRKRIECSMIKDTDEQLELELGSNNVKTFSPKKKSKVPKEPEGVSAEELMEQGLEIFAQELSEDAKGFFSIVFDKDNNPKIIWAGDIDMISALGSLEMAKNELYNNVFIDLES